MSDRDLVKIEMEPLRKVIPELEQLHATPRDRIRLIRRLTNRFGKGFRMMGEARNALAHFDGEQAEIRRLLNLGKG